MLLAVLLVFVFFSFFVAGEDFTFKLTQSTGTYDFWTTTPSRKVFRDDDVPTITGSEIKVYCAKNEFEPFVVVINPTSNGNVVVNLPTFSDSNIEVELFEVVYIYIDTASDDLGCDDCWWPDALMPISDGDQVSVVNGENRYIWVNIYVPTGVSSGDYSGDISIAGVDIPVTLHVFDFAVPKELHLKSQMNFGFQTVLSMYSVSGTSDDYWLYVNGLKKFWMDHRMTPKSALWPGGLNPTCCAEYDCDTQTITDPNGVWGFEIPQEDVLKDGIDGVVYPSYMFMTFVNGNDASVDPRPSTWCDYSSSGAYMVDGISIPGVTLEDLSGYNRKWFEYMVELNRYLGSFDLLDIAYHYGWNEPQDQEDCDSVAWYSSLLKKFAPDIRLMVSEEAKEGIYANTDYPWGKIDIWLPVLNNYEPENAFSRKAYCDEETWVYFLHGTVPPMLNPITLDHQALEGKLLAWLMWKYRIEGIAYYACNDWGSNPFTSPEAYGQNGNTFLFYPPATDNNPITYGSNNHRFAPSIRMEMIRDGFEDWEYLYVLNGNRPPSVSSQGSDADKISQKLVSSLNSYVRDDEYAYNLRKTVGLYLGGEDGVTVQDVLDLQRPAPHERAEGDPSDYYINFQEPGGNPTAEPLIGSDGNTYEKWGWEQYSDEEGAGWFGEMDNVMYGWAGGDDLEGSIVFDDWGRVKTFQYVVPNGCYDVTVSVGWAGRTYDKNYIAVNNVVFFDGESNAGGYLQETNEICVVDYMITMDMGIFDEYTMLNYMTIEYTGSGSGDVEFSSVSYSEPPPEDLYCQMQMGNYNPDNYFVVDKSGDDAGDALNGGEAFGVTFGVMFGVFGMFFCCACCIVMLLLLCLSVVLFFILVIASVAGGGVFAVRSGALEKLKKSSSSGNGPSKDFPMKNQKKNNAKKKPPPTPSKPSKRGPPPVPPGRGGRNKK